MAVQVEIWQSDIQKAFYNDIPFLRYGVDVSAQVLDGKVVHIPQAGTLSVDISKDRSSFPATAKRRTDSEKTYTLNAFSTDPFHIPDAEQAELSFDKRQSLLEHVKDALMERVSTEILYSWAFGLTGVNAIRTTGANVQASAPSATGTRKAFTEQDLALAAQTILNQSKGTAQDLVALVPYNLLGQLLNTKELGLAQSFLSDEERRSGFIARLQNFLILPTYSRLFAQENGTLKDVKAVASASDNEVILCWSKSAVEYALGSVKMFASQADPLYYGDVYSFEVRAGGARRRLDNAGVISITQTR